MTGSAYSVRAVLKQEPAALVAVLAHAFALVIALGWFTISAAAVGLISSLMLSILTVFYIRPLTVSNDALAGLGPAVPPDAGAGQGESDPGV